MSFLDYSQWFQVSFTRRTGTPPAVNTLVNKQRQLSAVANALGVPKESHSILTALAEREDVDALLDALTMKYEPGTVRGIVGALRSLKTFGKTVGMTIDVRAEDVPKPGSQRAHRLYTRTEIDEMFIASKAIGFRWHLFIATLIDTGCRVTEALEITFDAVDTERKFIKLPHTKSGQPQYLLITTRLAALYADERVAKLPTVADTRQAYSRDRNRFVFPWSYEAPRQRLVDFTRKLGIEYKGHHGFRHSYATHKLQDGVPIHVVSKLLRHSSVKTTESIYDHTTILDFARYVA